MVSLNVIPVLMINNSLYTKYVLYNNLSCIEYFFRFYCPSIFIVFFLSLDKLSES